VVLHFIFTYIWVSLIILYSSTISFLCMCVVGIKGLPLFLKEKHSFCGLGNCDVWFHGSNARGRGCKKVGPWAFSSSPPPMQARPRTKLENAQHRCSTRLSYKPGKLNGKENKVTTRGLIRWAPHPFMSGGVTAQKGEASQATGQEIVMRCQCKYGHGRYLTARASRSHVLRSLTVSLSFFTAALKEYPAV
jgi:hypothetical protein